MTPAQVWHMQIFSSFTRLYSYKSYLRQTIVNSPKALDISEYIFAWVKIKIGNVVLSIILHILESGFPIGCWEHFFKLFFFSVMDRNVN